MTPAVQALLSQLPADGSLDIMQLWQALHERRYTGRICFDFQNGLPRQVDIAAPIRLAICTALPAEGVDKTTRSRAG